MITSSVQKGDYEFFEAADGQPLLTFDDRYFALADQPARRWIESDADHDVTRIWERGDFVWLRGPDFDATDSPQLYLREREANTYREYLVTREDDRRVLVPTDTRLSPSELNERAR